MKRTSIFIIAALVIGAGIGALLGYSLFSGPSLKPMQPFSANPNNPQQSQFFSPMADMMRSSAGRNFMAELMASEEMRDAMVQIMKDPESRKAMIKIWSQPEMRQTMLEILKDPAMRAIVNEVK